MIKNPKVEITDKKLGYNGFFKIIIAKIRQELFQGGHQDITREVTDRGDAVAILAYDPVQDVVVLGREMRAGILLAGEYPYTMGLPAGGINKGETAVQAARRETVEETGLKLRKAQLIYDRLYSSAGGSSERISIVFGLVTAPKQNAILGLASEHENIQRIVMPAEQFFKTAGTRKMPDLMTNLGASWLMQNRARVIKANRP